MSADLLPQRTRVYQNHHLDSTRWDAFRFRDDDIVISTSYKAGTTWMQTIVAHLLFADGQLPGPVTEIAPWVGLRTRPLDTLLARCEAQQHRRFVKSHLALDGLPYLGSVRYVMVCRDARDVFMSLYNHYANYTAEAHARFNQAPGRVGPPLPECPNDINWLWRQWIRLGWFEWEQDGWPYWSHLHHLDSWWAYRQLPNILLVHYNDLTADLAGEMHRIADFLDISVPERAWPRIVEACTFESMRANADDILPNADDGWQGGAARFLFKGSNGRWKGVLSDAELSMYDEAAARLDPTARRWMEQGRQA